MKNAYTEVYMVINNLNNEIKEKIPNEIKEFIFKNANFNNLIIFDNIEDIKISDEARAILSAIYEEYL